MTGALTNHLWQSTLFAVAAGLLAAALRQNRAQVRFWLWFSASLKFFVPFALLMTLGSHLQWAPAAQKIATSRGLWQSNVTLRSAESMVWVSLGRRLRQSSGCYQVRVTL